MTSRKRGQRNWNDPPAQELPFQLERSPDHPGISRYSVVDNGGGVYHVRKDEHEWLVMRTTDGELYVEERTYPSKRCDPTVLKAVHRYCGG